MPLPLVPCVRRRLGAAATDVDLDARLPRVYGVWLAGALVSQLGDSALFFALGWAASGFGGVAAGWVLSAVALPRTVLLLVGGTVGDRFGARRVMIAGDAAMLAVAAVLGLVVQRWGASLSLLLLMGVVVGTVDAFYLPSAGSMPRRLVAEAQLARAVALRQSGSQLVSMAGSPMGGALVALAGLSAASWVDAVTFAVVLAVLVAIRPRLDVAAGSRPVPVLRGAIDGVLLAARTPALRSGLLLVASVAGFVIPSGFLLVPLLAREHGWPAATAGLVLGAQSVGTLVATVVVARRGAARRPGLVAAAGLLFIAVGQLGLGLTAMPEAAVAAAFGVGLGVGVFVANLSPVLLQTAPVTHLARVQALLGLVQSGALLLTDNALGSLASAVSPGITMVLCAGVVTGCAVLAVLTPTLRRLSASPARPRADQPAQHQATAQ